MSIWKISKEEEKRRLKVVGKWIAIAVLVTNEFFKAMKGIKWS